MHNLGLRSESGSSEVSWRALGRAYGSCPASLQQIQSLTCNSNSGHFYANAQPYALMPCDLPPAALKLCNFGKSMNMCRSSLDSRTVDLGRHFSLFQDLARISCKSTCSNLPPFNIYSKQCIRHRGPATRMTVMRSMSFPGPSTPRLSVV